MKNLINRALVAEKKLFILLAAVVMTASAMAKEEVTIDKDNCTITKNGKTYHLYGKVKIVENFENTCGRVKLVENFEDVKVKIVDNFEDIKIKIVNNFEGVKK